MVLWTVNITVMLAVPYRRRPYSTPVDRRDTSCSIPQIVANERLMAILLAPIVWMYLTTHTHLHDMKSPMDVLIVVLLFAGSAYAASHSNHLANMKATEFVKVLGDHTMHVSRSIWLQYIVTLYICLIACCVFFFIHRSTVAALPAGTKLAHIILLCISLYLVYRRPPWVWDILETHWGLQILYNVSVMSLLICTNNVYADGMAFMYLVTGYSVMGLMKPGPSDVNVNG